MKFCNQLNEYIELLGCTAKELGSTADLSAATLSRYRSGERDRTEAPIPLINFVLPLPLLLSRPVFRKLPKTRYGKAFIRQKTFPPPIRNTLCRILICWFLY